MNSIKNKAFLLKQKSKTIGVSELHANRYRHYIIGFKNVFLARKIHYNIHPEPSIRLERSDFIDITKDVKKSFNAIGLNSDSIDSKITIDVFSKIYIPKMLPSGGYYNPMNDGGYHVEEISIEDLFLMPFEQNIGVILPSEVYAESAKEFVLSCQIIDPVDSLKHFRKSLKCVVPPHDSGNF
jgi:hypothetical protein